MDNLRGWLFLLVLAIPYYGMTPNHRVFEDGLGISLPGIFVRKTAYLGTRALTEGTWSCSTTLNKIGKGYKSIICRSLQKSRSPFHHGLGRLANVNRLFTPGDDRRGLDRPSTVEDRRIEQYESSTLRNYMLRTLASLPTNCQQSAHHRPRSLRRCRWPWTGHLSTSWERGVPKIGIHE